MNNRTIANTIERELAVLKKTRSTLKDRFDAVLFEHEIPPILSALYQNKKAINKLNRIRRTMKECA